MDPDDKKFGLGPRELTGAVDLLSYYKLQPHYEFFCKRPLPSAISDTHYLHNVVGDTEIRKGEGMELNQLFQSAHYLREPTTHIQPFDLERLGQAFHLRESAPVHLPNADKGTPTISGKPKSESKDKERKHKKHKDRDKDKEHKKHKHRHKDRSKDKDKDKDREKKKEKKRKHEGNEELSDMHKHKKSKHKSSKGDELERESLQPFKL